MDTAEMKRRLQRKEREVLADISRTEGDARTSGEAEVQDSTDKAVADEGKDALFQETSSDWNVLTQVRDALQRIEKGTYGKCVDCGRQIEHHRLTAVPWTPYCIDDQRRHDREAYGGRAAAPTL
jgi:DnaK suppressor protein